MARDLYYVNYLRLEETSDEFVRLFLKSWIQQLQPDSMLYKYGAEVANIVGNVYYYCNAKNTLQSPNFAQFQRLCNSMVQVSVIANTKRSKLGSSDINDSQTAKH